MPQEKTIEQLEEELNMRTTFLKYIVTRQEIKEQEKRIENLRRFLSDIHNKKVLKSHPPEVAKQKTAEDEEREKQALLELIESVGKKD